MCHIKGKIWHKGFTLIEVMITVTILSFGMTAIVESFLISLDTFNYYSIYLKIKGWTDQKIWEVQDTLCATGALDVDKPLSGSFVVENKKISWRMGINLIEPDLYKLDLALNWKAGARTAKVSRAAYAVEYSRIKGHKR